MSGAFNTGDGGYVHVYTYGVCLENGRDGPVAGIGVWFADGHPLNVSRSVRYGDTTLRAAEIRAVTEAAKIAAGEGVEKLLLTTQSVNVPIQPSEWLPAWIYKGRKLTAVENIANAAELAEMEESLNRMTTYWVEASSRSKLYGVQRAKQLAENALIRRF